MGLVIRLHDIVSPNQFKVYYKQATSPYPMNSGYSLYGTFAAGTSTVNISGITINFNSNYWFKIEDQTTGRYIIENIETNDPIAYMDCCPQPIGLGAVCYHSCYPPTINSITCSGLVPATATPTPTPTSTPTPTPTATVVGPTPTPTSTPTPTPTPTETSDSCLCYCVTYDVNDLPNDLYVRYSVCGTASVETELISAIESMDNGDGTATACICVKQGGAYSTPVCVQGGIEIVCPVGISWSMGSSCTSAPTCFIIGDPTPTPTSTPTPTPTATPTPYYLLLSRCDSAPNTVTGWTMNAYTQSQIMVGDIFYSAGGFYYQVINYQTAQPNPAGTIDGTKSNDYTSCDQTPGHYVAPTPDPGQSILIHTGQTFSNTTEPCAMYESAIATNSRTVYLNGHNIPANGDYAYNTAACNVGDEFNGNSNYYAALANSTRYTFTIGSGGYINNVTACGAIPTATSTPTPTPTPTSIPLVGLFKSQGLSEFNSHCGNNYLINSPFYGETISINSLYGTYVYSDMNYTPLDGGSLWYAVGSDDQANTSDLPYYSIQIAGNGEVTSVQYITSCSGGGSQA